MQYGISFSKYINIKMKSEIKNNNEAKPKEYAIVVFKLMAI